jgi:hypothetical protein
MRKKLLTRRQEEMRWIRLAVLLLITIGLVLACIWIWRNLAEGQSPFQSGAAHISTATATAVLEFAPEQDQTPFPLQGEDRGNQQRLPSEPAEPLPLDGSMPYMLQMGTPIYLPAFSHADKGCQWIGFGGQVFDAQGAGKDGLVVFLTGTIDNQPIHLFGITAPQNVFGSGGYEIFLSDRLPEKTQSVEIQLFTVQGHPLSAPVAVAPPITCDQNLALVNFQSSYTESMILFPLVLGQQ